ncbi:MAG: hypothetical protein AAB209_11590 [Bacteroidota bacterium]
MMKALTITAVLGTLVAIPFIFGRRKPEVVPIIASENPRQLDTNLRYDVDDFFTQ